VASGTPATSVRKGGLPSLEIIEKRFASKLSKEVINGASDAVSSPTDKYAPIAGNKELSPPGGNSSAMARSKSEGSSPAPLPKTEMDRLAPATKAESASAVPSHEGADGLQSITERRTRTGGRASQRGTVLLLLLVVLVLVLLLLQGRRAPRLARLA